MKACSVCAEVKSLTEFYRRSASRDGLDPKCKDCCSTNSKKNYAKKCSEIKAGVSARHRETAESLDDYYLRRLMRKDMEFRTAIPQGLIEVKRVQIQIKRQLKEMK